MSEVFPPGVRHEEFLEWAKQQGVFINGVGPAIISGHGLGIVAQRRIEADEVLCDVPASVLLTIDRIPEHFRRLHKGVTVHGLLASYLAFGGPTTSCYSPWEKSWPSMQDFQESMPILWPSFMREPLDNSGNPHYMAERPEDSVFILPPAIAGRWAHYQMCEFFNIRDTAPMYRQEQKLKGDWEIVSKVFPDKTLQAYTYYWLIVNTRSFYFEPSSREVVQSHDDCMVLCPFVDYFNHNDHGCRVNFSEKGYTVTSDRTYDVGEQIFTSYGSHSNDFLLYEYGFILETNKYDYLPLDDFFLGKQINGNLKKSLEKAGYLGNYTLDRDGVCFRTQVAIRRRALKTYHWKKFAAGVDTEDEEDRVAAMNLLQNRILLPYKAEVEQALQYLQRTGNAIPAGAKKTLINRWKQIRDVIQQALLIHGPRSA